MQERKKLTLVKAQAYWKATKRKKSQMLDNFCQSTGYCRRYLARVLHRAGGRYLLGDCVLVADPTKHIQVHPSHWTNMQNTLGYKNILGLRGDTALPGTVLPSCRH